MFYNFCANAIRPDDFLLLQLLFKGIGQIRFDKKSRLKRLRTGSRQQKRKGQNSGSFFLIRMYFTTWQLDLWRLTWLQWGHKTWSRDIDLLHLCCWTNVLSGIVFEVSSILVTKDSYSWDEWNVGQLVTAHVAKNCVKKILTLHYFITFPKPGGNVGVMRCSCCVFCKI